MAVNTGGCDSKSNGLKIEGDLGDLQVTDVSDSEDNGEEIGSMQKNSRTISPVSALPPSLVQTSTVPVFGNVSVTESENVQFGNNTYFNGPVTIKQVVHSKTGVENGSYTRTDEDDTKNDGSSQKNNLDLYPLKKHEILVWHKLTFSAVCVTIIGGIIAIVLVLPGRADSQYGNTSSHETDGSDPLLISPEYLRIVSRDDWLAQPVEEVLDKIRQPVPWVIITHTATDSCSSQSICVLRVRVIQSFHIESRGWSDIGYNFLVGGDGSVYYGRGWDYIGAHTQGYNKYSIGIAFIGTFNNYKPPKQQIEACQKLIKLGIKLGKLREDYKLLGHRQLMSTLSPGDQLFDIIKTWPHFASNYTDIKELLPNY